MKKPSQSDIENIFVERGYKLLSKYKNSKTKLKFRCPNGHEGSIRLEHFVNGYGCNICTKGGHLTLEDKINLIISKGYEVINHTKTKYDITFSLRCSEGHNISMTWRTFKKNETCYVCDGRVSVVDYNLVKESFENEGYELLSSSYRNSSSYLYYMCPKGHTGKIIWSNWNKGIRCSECSYDNLRVRVDDVNNFLVGSGKEALVINREQGSPYITLKCECGEVFRSKLRNIKRSGPICPECDKYISSAEKEIYNYLKHKGLKVEKNVWYITKDRSEIDIVIPDLKTGIEYCGLYWHTEVTGGKNQDYHLRKLEKANSNGYTLLTIFEDEYILKGDLVKSILSRKLGVIDGFRIHARECVIENIESSVCNDFLNKYHLQGKGHSSVKLGAHFGGYLIAVMTFSKKNIAKGFKGDTGHWELDRYCAHPDFCVPGVASKLLRTFESNFKWRHITSFADRRWSNGDLYYRLGFKHMYNTRPNYWYIKKGHIGRMHRYGLRKNSDDDKNKTEWENRLEQGYDRIWDCGNIKFVKEA